MPRLKMNKPSNRLKRGDRLFADRVRNTVHSGVDPLDRKRFGAYEHGKAHVMVVVVHPYNGKDLVFRWPVDLGVHLTAKRLLVMPGKAYQTIERTLDLHLLFSFLFVSGLHSGSISLILSCT